VLAVAHRAGNALPDLHSAVELGADVLEADVHHWRGRLEIRHAKALGPLPWHYDAGALTPISTSPLLLHDLLDALHRTSTLMLDLKGPGAVGLHTAEAVHLRVPEKPVLVCSRWWPGLNAFRDRSWARPILTARNRGELLRLRRRVRRSAPYGVSVHRSLLSPALVEELHERVERVLTWPVNDDEALEQVLRAGVSGVISDEPEVLRSVLELPGRRAS
jgi:glycerophosphoryl diester phosphodiesterase